MQADLELQKLYDDLIAMNGSYAEEAKRVINDFDLTVATQSRTRLFNLNDLLNSTKKQLNELKLAAHHELIQAQIIEIKKELQKINDDRRLAFFDGFLVESIRQAMTELCNEQPDNIYVVVNDNEKSWQYYAMMNSKRTDVNLNPLVAKQINATLGVKGGGKPNYVQGGGLDKAPRAEIRLVLRNFGFAVA